MPRQNRVTPLGELIATPERGLVYGNRGCLHDEQGRIRRRYATRRWIACRLEFKGWHRAPLLQPGKFTELFFLDEATAFAAGHRPCALCRREDYVRFNELWPGPGGADAIDLRLHGERLGAATWRATCRTAFVLTTASPGWWSATPRCAGRRPATRSARRGPPAAPGHHPAVAGRCPGHGWEGAVPLLHPSILSG